MAMSSLDQLRRMSLDVINPRQMHLVKPSSPKAKKKLVAPGEGPGASQQELFRHVTLCKQIC